MTATSSAPFSISVHDPPLAVSTDNPLYFTFRGKTVLLAGHQNTRPIQDNVYGRPHASLIEDPDHWTTYLDWMNGHGMNFIRMWTYWSTGFEGGNEGAICTTLPFNRPAGGEAAPDGLPKFDLTDMNTPWWTRLEQCVRDCADRGIIVAILLFDVFTFGTDTVGSFFRGNPFRAENNVNGLSANANGQNWALDGMYESPSSAMLAVQHGFVEKVIDTVNAYPNVIYEVANELYAHAWQVAMVEHIQAYQATKPNQHPVWLSAGGRVDAGTVQMFTQDEALNNAADIWGPDGGQDYGDGVFREVMPLQSYAAKPGIIDTDHGITSDYVTERPWKAFTRGYHYNLYENPTDGGAWWGAFPYETMSSPLEETMRANVGQLAKYANERFADLASMSPTDATSVCTTTFCLRSAGEEYLCYAPTNAAFTVGELIDGASYTYEWFDPETATITSDGNTFTANGSTETFTPPYDEHAVLYLRRTG
ncbi:MAG: hypothetical protein JRI23_10030 [Deltaproteobacteria bacterium]|jgi:hypothetical protein|nr:hypothetical protein [Deltaproteobacteria bacterium]MBW2532010.1 hypothetical protein [Deltaproteobacteria bacterium]